MSEAEFKTIIEKQGVHSFLIVLSTRSVREAMTRDLWLRCIIIAFTTLSVAGSEGARVERAFMVSIRFRTSAVR